MTSRMFSLSDINSLTVCLLRTTLAEIRRGGTKRDATTPYITTLFGLIYWIINGKCYIIMLPGLQFNFVDDTVCGLIEIESLYCANIYIIITELMKNIHD